MTVTQHPQVSDVKYKDKKANDLLSTVFIQKDSINLHFTGEMGDKANKSFTICLMDYKKTKVSSSSDQRATSYPHIVLVMYMV